MTESKLKIPLARADVLELYFLEHRAKLIDIGAFLDRVERADGAGQSEDFRVKGLRKATAILLDSSPEKARRMLDVFSDHLPELPISAHQTKGAKGATREELK